MNINLEISPSTLTDRELVGRHLDGDRTAFRHIVERHQAMVCALGYSACGDIARSEDIAQEVFIVAWKQLPDLREPEKLRGWLAGITRNLINNAFRRHQRAPTERAEELSAEIPSPGETPRDQAINADEAALMWQALAGIPENYREPMVLFYREGRSIAAVGETLEISEELVRQRLARGRAMLTERMAKLVEETLERSAPTPAFAGAVLLAMPTLMAPTMMEATLAGGGTKALTTGGMFGAAAKGGVAVKIIAALAALPALMNGLTEYLRFKTHLESPSRRRREEIIKLHLLPLLVNGVLLGCTVFILWLPVSSNWKSLALVALAAAIVLASRFERQRREIARADLANQPAPAFEYRSSGGFLGLPWVHIRAGGGLCGKKVAGWIAISDGVAVGGLFASAPLAVAPTSVGGLALGLAALGVCTGGGWAAGGIAVAAYAAQGGLALAPDFAQGVHAVAAHANDPAAAIFFQEHLFFRFTHLAGNVAVWAAFFGWLPPLLLIGWHLATARRPHR